MVTSRTQNPPRYGSDRAGHVSRIEDLTKAFRCSRLSFSPRTPRLAAWQAAALRSALLLARSAPLTAQATTLYRLTGLSDLPNGRKLSFANSINEAGQIVGFISTTNAANVVVIRASLWQNGVLTYLGDQPGGASVSDGRGINHAASVVGDSGAAGDTHAFQKEFNVAMSVPGDYAGGADTSFA
jgi:hypothetical protein